MSFQSTLILMSIEGVNRGYLKIEGAVRAFDFDFKDKTVLDIGSSTGGFTEFALNHGAKKVIAVEKGSHQMKAPLRFDPRIDLHEKTDIFDVGTAISIFEDSLRRTASKAASEPLGRGSERSVSEKKLIAVPDVIMADVSFISLTKVLSYAKHHLADKHTVFLMMLKPQFEADPKDLRNGVVKNETTRRQIIKRFENWLKQNGFIVVKKHDNELHGKTGNIERFYYLKLAK